MGQGFAANLHQIRAPGQQFHLRPSKQGRRQIDPLFPLYHRGGQRISPREISISSIVVRVTASPACACVFSPSGAMILSIFVVSAEGRTMMSSPSCTVPEARVPAKPRKSEWGTVYPLHRKAKRAPGFCYLQCQPSPDAASSETP